MDSCLVSQVKLARTALIAITVDEFLVTDSTTDLTDDLHSVLTKKNHIKRLGVPTEFIGCRISDGNHGEINLTQPALMLAKISNEDMENADERQTKMDFGAKIRPPDDEDVYLPHAEAKCRQIVGNLRYLTDCTRPGHSCNWTDRM